MGQRTGSADLPLHGGRVPAWLADRMTALGAVMPEECQSIPITAPNAWNQKGWASRRSSSSRP